MTLKQLSNVTAKQMIDATRAYRELIATRRSLQKLGGRMFWKFSGNYAYLAQRSYFDSRKVEHLGVKSSQTELRLKTHEDERARLRQREAMLRERISVYERMNKAVRAGSVANAVIDTIRLLESANISEDCVWVGTPAQHAYWQVSGFVTPESLGDGGALGNYLVFVRRKIDATSLNKICRSKALKVIVVKGEQSALLIINSNATAHARIDLDLPEAHILRLYSKFIKDTVQ